MKQTGSSDRFHIIVQRDTVRSDKRARLYRLCQATTLEEDVIENLGKINTGYPDVLRNFLEWGLKHSAPPVRMESRRFPSSIKALSPESPPIQHQ
jgi:hypothetical protein